MTTQTTHNEDTPRIAVFVHVYYVDLWPEIAAHLHHIPGPFDLYVNAVRDTYTDDLGSGIREEFPGAVLSVSPNRGYDIGGLLESLRLADLEAYDLVCKIHTKRGAHLSYGEDWRKSLLDSLLGSPDIVREIWRIFESEPNTGMVGDVRYRFGSELIGANFEDYSALCQRLDIDPDLAQLDFFGGTMFWCRPLIFSSLLELGLGIGDLEPPRKHEAGHTHDGQKAHAIERLLGRICTASGLRLRTVNRLHFLTVCHEGQATSGQRLATEIEERVADVNFSLIRSERPSAVRALRERLELGAEFAVYLPPCTHLFSDPRTLVNTLADCNLLMIVDEDRPIDDVNLIAARRCDETLDYLALYEASPNRASIEGTPDPTRYPGVRISSPLRTGLGFSLHTLPRIEKIDINDRGDLFFDGRPCAMFRWPDDREQDLELYTKGRQTQGLRFLLRAYTAYLAGIPEADRIGGRRARLRILPHLFRQALVDRREDALLGLRLWRREGGQRFLYRCYWYLRGRQLPYELPDRSNDAS